MKAYAIVDTAGRPAWWQMALDEALLEYVASRSGVVFLRVYTFSPSAVSIGYFQSLKHSVDLEEARRRGVTIVRRFTGGGAVYHDENGEVTYSIAAPATGVLGGVVDSYRVLCTAVAKALQLLGVNAVYSGVNDVVAGGRKVSGNAQARKRGALLQHGTILVDPDLEAMEKLLVVPREKLESHSASRISERVAGIAELLGRKPGKLEVADALIQGFSNVLGLEFREAWYPRSVLEAAERLAAKYRDWSWTARR